MRVFTTVGTILAISIAGFAGYIYFRPTDRAIADFLSAENRGEDQLADPLILTGCRSASTIAGRITDPRMPLRRYAIGYVGNRRCAVALPALLTIAENATELDYFRGDAIEAIAQIDRGKGIVLAKRYASRNDFLGQSARAIIAGREVGVGRTYWQALRGVHE